MNKYVKKVAQYTSGQLLAKISIFFTIPILTKNLSTVDYGIYGNISFFIGVCSLVILLGLQQALFSFYNGDKTKNYLLKLFSTMFSSMGVASIIMAGLGFLFLDRLSFLLAKNTDIVSILYYVFCIAVLDSFTAVIGSIFNMEEDAKKYTVVTTIKTVSVLIGLLVAAYFNIVTVLYIYQLTLTFSLIQFIISIYLLRSKFNFNFLTDFIRYFDTKIARDMLVFSLPMIPGTMATLMLRSADRLMLTHLLGNGLESSGLYSVGYRMGMIMGFIFTIISLSFYPFVIKKYQNENNDGFGLVREMFGQICKFGCLIGVGIILFTPEVFIFYVGKEFYVAQKYVIYGVASIFLVGIMNYYNIGFYINKKSVHIASIVVIGSLLNIGFNWLLIPLLGITGAGISSILSYFIAACVHGINSKRKFGIESGFWKVLFVIIGFIIVHFIACNVDASITNFSVKFLCYLIVSLITIRHSYNKKELLIRNILSPLRGYEEN